MRAMLTHGGEATRCYADSRAQSIGDERVRKSVSLDGYIEGGPTFVFHGFADGVPITVELDSSAVMKLAGKQVGAEVRPAIEAAHDVIEAAVMRLFDQGHATVFEGGGPSRVLLSAIDLN
jgi:hypothetical protein